MKLLVISGLSGAGKSIAMNALEDLGFYCVDNLPVSLLDAFAAEMQSTHSPFHERVAVAIDARNPAASLRELPVIIKRLREAGRLDELIFLEADRETLIQRFSETRRKHPLTQGELSLAEAIGQERQLLQPLRECADLCVDTSRTNLHELRQIMRQQVHQRPLSNLMLLFQSFGYKHSLPPNGDMVFDVRCLPNPHWEPRLRAFTGRDPEVKAFLEGQEGVERMVQDIRGFLETWIPQFEAENRSYLTVCIGCTGGQHRSVYIAERLGGYFAERRPGVLVRHRELG